jgi:hypothetical protein
MKQWTPVENNWISKDLMKSWVKALRSGDYPQGAARLRSRYSTNGALTKNEAEGIDCYCCIGVLYDICDMDGRIREDNSKNGIGLSHVITILPQRFIKSLVSLNDEGVDFEVIADFIEYHIPNL